MKKIIRSISIFNLFIISILSIAKPTISSAAELKSTNIPGVYQLQEDLDNQNSSEDTFTQIFPYNSVNLLRYASGTTETQPFTYDFKNYVDTSVVFDGAQISKVVFKFTTTTWSNSTSFEAKLYKYMPLEYTVNSGYVHKSKGNPVYVTFTLDSRYDYIIRFDNSVYGERIVGSGDWTITYR